MVMEKRLEGNNKKLKQIYSQTTLTELILEVHNKKQRREVTRGGPSSVSCDVCMDVISISDSIHVPKCNHTFCRDCIESYLPKKIQEDVTQVKCPNSKCRIVLMPEFCRNLIPERMYERWTDALTEISALENAREIECPSEDCEGVFTVDKRRFGTKKLCLKCGRRFCLRCKSELFLQICEFCERTKRFNNHRNRGFSFIYNQWKI